MKTILAGLAAAALLAFAPAVSHAQTRTIAYGRTSIAFTPSFLEQLAGQGVTITDLATGQPLQNGFNSFTALEGALDLKSAYGEVVFAGGYVVNINGQTIRVQDLAFNISSSGAVISGAFTTNDVFAGRQPIFIVNMNPNLTLPIPVQNGAITLPGMSLGLAPNFVALVNQAAGQPILNPGIQIAAANEYAVFAPATPTALN